jgi:beta-lactamase class A
MRTKKILLFISLFIFLAVGAYFGQRQYVKLQRAKQERLLYEARKTTWQDLRQHIRSEISQFKGEAGIVIKDLGTGWEFADKKDKLFPSASLAKIPLMAACFRASEEGRIKLSRNVALKSSDKLTGSGVLKEMKVGATFSVEELIGLMIYDSDNTASNMLTNIVGIDYLNNSFKAFGLKNTSLSRKIADFSARDNGLENYTTAEDMAFILENIYRKGLIGKDASERCLRILKLSRMNDRIPRYLPAEVTIAHKTGLERGICHDAGIVFTCKGNFLIVVLTKHSNSNSSSSKEFIARIALLVYRYFEQLQEG